MIGRLTHTLRQIPFIRHTSLPYRTSANILASALFLPTPHQRSTALPQIHVAPCSGNPALRGLFFPSGCLFQRKVRYVMHFKFWMRRRRYRNRMRKGSGGSESLVSSLCQKHVL